jgi:hypothetical protein
MRFLKAWWWRIAVVVGLVLILASLEYFLFHQPFLNGLIKGVAIFGGILLFRHLFRYVDSPKQPRPQITAEQQPPKAEEQDASGG